MATEQQRARKQLSTIPAALECRLCLEVFDDPRNLPCGHTFCLKCLSKTVGNKKKPTPCSLCKKEWQVPPEGISALAKNYVAGSFRDLVPSTGECGLAMDERKHGPVEFFCIDCWDVLCSVCRESHRHIKVTRDHAVKPVRELSVEDIALHRNQTTSICNLHKEQKVVVYCKECRDVACTVCCVTKHSKHECIELELADVDFIGIIKKALDETKAAHIHNTEEMKKVNETHLTLKTHQANMTETIKNVCR